MSALLEQGRRGQTVTGVEIIDMHGHMGACDFSIPDLSGEGLVSVMDRIGVRTMLISHMQCLGRDFTRGNQEVLEAMRAFPSRILGYVALWPENEDVVRAEVERRLGEGFTGIKLHDSNGFAYTEQAYLPAYEIANERRLPVLFHLWGGQNQFDQVAEVATRFDEMSILLAHTGSQHLAGYLRLAREYSHVHLDTCLSTSPRGLIARLVAEAGADKVVWGSDAYFYSQAHQIGKVLGADLPDDVKAQILSGNAKRILARAGTGGPP